MTEWSLDVRNPNGPGSRSPKYAPTVYGLCDWVQRREKLLEAPSFNVALASKYISHFERRI